MKLTKSEIIRYITLVIILGSIPILFDSIIEYLSNFAPGRITANFAGFFNTHKYHFATVKKLIVLINLFGTGIVSSYFIRLSEKRIGNDQNIIWILLGLTLNILGFITYAIWCLLIRNDLFYKEDNAIKEHGNQTRQPPL